MKTTEFEIMCSDCSYRAKYMQSVRYINPYEDCFFGPSIILCWCVDCNGLVQAARFPSSREYADVAEDLRHRSSSLGQVGFFERFFPNKKKKVLLESIQKRIQSVSEMRVSAPESSYHCCLTCGSRKVIEVTMPEPDFFEFNTIDVDHKCGGLILAKRGFAYHRELPLKKSPYL